MLSEPNTGTKSTENKKAQFPLKKFGLQLSDQHEYDFVFNTRIHYVFFRVKRIYDKTVQYIGSF
jgi:hypothetical protein